MELSKIIRRPIVTEKSMSERDAFNRYFFKVSNRASKAAIADEVEKLFDVDVIDVKTLIMPGKQRRIRRTRGYTKTPKWKKAVVTVKSGQEIKLITEGK